VKFS